MTDGAPGATKDAPLYFKWVTDDDGRIRWDRILLGIAVTALTAYISVQVQRAGSDIDFARTIRMSIARKRITAGIRLQRIGRAVEDAGWAAYEHAR